MTVIRKALKDAALVAFATKSGAARTSVIVEAKRPATSADAPVKKRLSGSPTELLPPMAKARRATKAVAKVDLSKLQGDLEKLGLADHARRNDLAGAFVVEVTPSQLLELAEAPSVQAIRSNRHHRRLAA
jgi:hypothetical protein